MHSSLRYVAGAELVTAGPDRRFHHGLLQEIVYQNILVARRTELHTRVGTALEAQDVGDPESLERLVALGANKRRGARYLMSAGDWARSMYANADAILHYERALDALEHCDAPAAATQIETERLVARDRMADLLGPTGRRSEDWLRDDLGDGAKHSKVVAKTANSMAFSTNTLRRA